MGRSPEDLPEVRERGEAFAGRAIRVTLEEVLSPDGRCSLRETVRHPGAVAILPILDDGRVVLIENFRHAVGGLLLEVPAGTLEPGEIPRDCAERELVEETGYRPGSLRLIQDYYTTPGFTDERMWLYAAWNLESGEQNLQPGEHIQVLTRTQAQVEELLAEGKIIDGKTILALLWWLQTTK